MHNQAVGFLTDRLAAVWDYNLWLEAISGGGHVVTAPNGKYDVPGDDELRTLVYGDTNAEPAIEAESPLDQLGVFVAGTLSGLGFVANPDSGYRQARGARQYMLS